MGITAIAEIQRRAIRVWTCSSAAADSHLRTSSRQSKQRSKRLTASCRECSYSCRNLRALARCRGAWLNGQTMITVRGTWRQHSAILHDQDRDGGSLPSQCAGSTRGSLCVSGNLCSGRAASTALYRLRAANSQFVKLLVVAFASFASL